MLSYVGLNVLVEGREDLPAARGRGRDAVRDRDRAEGEEAIAS